MQAGPDLDADVAHRVLDGAGAPDRPRGPVEGGKEAVPGGVDLTAAEPLKEPADAGVVLIEQVSPAAVTELVGLLRRADDVSEQHRGQAAIEIRRPLCAGQGILDHI